MAFALVSFAITFVNRKQSVASLILILWKYYIKFMLNFQNIPLCLLHLDFRHIGIGMLCCVLCLWNALSSLLFHFLEFRITAECTDELLTWTNSLFQSLFFCSSLGSGG